MLPTGRGGEALADLSEFTVTKKTYGRERIEVNDWIDKIFKSYPYDLITVEWPDGTDEGIAYIKYPKPEDYDVYWDKGTIVWIK